VRPPAPPADEPPLVKGPSEQEKFLLRSVQDYATPKQGTWPMGVKYHAELGVLYLKEKRFDEADKFFQRLEKETRIPQYRTLGHIGHAMVLAFQDQTEQSNTEFQKLLDLEKILIDKGDKRGFSFSAVVRASAALSEMLASALRHNYINSPGTFPKGLEKYRQPPAPTLKGQSS
jgi:hypothetical protein